MDIPAKLAERKQWIVWRLENGRKIPYQPTGAKARSNDPTTWYTLAECQAVVEQYSGLGFVFSKDDPFTGIDLDNVYHDGEIADWAAAVLAELPTYAEISPSGRGIKLWLRAKLPDGKGKKLVVQDGQQIEVYDRGRYFAFTGQTLDPDQVTVTPCQDALDAILERFWPKPIIQPVRGSAPPPDDVTRRAAAYVETIPGVSEGNNRDGVTMKVAAALVRGFELSIADALPIIRDWNTRCSPNTWPQDRIDKALIRKLTDAKNKPGETGWLLHGLPAPADDVDLSAILAGVNGAPAELPDVPRSPHAFPVECLRPPGLLSEVIDWNLRTALFPQPELALAGALSLLGTITGRKIQDRRRTRTNVYCLGLALSGSGKEHARTVNKEILARAGAEQMLGPEGLASSAGLVQFVAARKTILFQLDEISRLLETMRDPRRAPHLYKIGTSLMQLESNSHCLWIGEAYANAKQTPKINQPHACIYGTAVPRGFWESLTEDNVSEGLLGRMMVFEAGSRYVHLATPEHVEPPESLLSGVRWWLDKPFGPGDLSEENPLPEVAECTPEAARRLDGHFRGICDRRMREDDTRAALWSRASGKTAKLALLAACSRCTCQERIQIETCDADWAVAVSNWLTKRMLYQAYRHVSHNQREGDSKRLLRLLAKPMTRSEITRKTQWLGRRQREEILAELMESGEVAMRTEESAGTKPVTWYEAAQC
jgi:hypothetical protein